MLDPSGFGAPAPAAADNHLAFAGRRLRQACIACELAPGTFVHEAELAQRFGLGRAAVRVALTELAVSGFVSRHARQGWRVAAVDGLLARSVLEGRKLLEPALAEVTLEEGQREQLRHWRAMLHAVAGRDDAQARAMAHGLHQRVRDLLATRVAPLVAGWLRDVWDHAERLTKALELAGRPVPLGDLGPFLDALLAGHRAAALAELSGDHARFRATLADAFLDAAHLGPTETRPRMRKRAARTTRFQPAPSTTTTEETSR